MPALVLLLVMAVPLPAQAANREGSVGQPLWGFAGQPQPPARHWQAGKTAQDLQRQAVSGRDLPRMGGAEQEPPAAEATGSQGGPVLLELEGTVSQWRDGVAAPLSKPDEVLPLEKKHVLKAHAGYENGKNLSISAGPELMLTEKQHHKYKVNDTGPDSQLGISMQFEVRF